MTADATGLMAQNPQPRRSDRPVRTVRNPVRRRRWRIFRFSFLVAVVLVSAAIWITWFSSVLVIRKVEVSGVSGILVNRVLAAADVPIGLQMAKLDTGTINSGIAALPWVQASAVVRAWPRGVVLIVQPRVAIAELEGSSAGVASDGAVFVPPEPLQPGLPKIRGEGVGIVTAVPTTKCDGIVGALVGVFAITGLYNLIMIPTRVRVYAVTRGIGLLLNGVITMLAYLGDNPDATWASLKVERKEIFFA